MALAPGTRTSVIAVRPKNVGGGLTLSTDRLGRTQVQGLWKTRRALMEMGMERNLFEKWIKESAIMTAREANKYVPVLSGRLAISLRGQASKKVTLKGGGTERRFGGVVIARAPYAKAISLGKYFKKSGKRIKGNPYLRTAKNAAKPKIVAMFNTNIEKWLNKKGFNTNGF
jgi:hypothetical protein